MLNHKIDKIRDALASAVVLRPQFEVLYSIVVAHAVLVVNSFKFCQVSTDVFFHYQAMLRNIVVSHASGMPGASLKQVSSGSFYDPTTPCRGQLSEVKQTTSNIGAFFRAVRELGRPLYVARRPRKNFFTMRACKTLMVALPVWMGFLPNVLGSPNSIASMIAEKVLGCLQPVRVNLELFGARCAFRFHHNADYIKVMGVI